ncbi:MAG: MFS transporter, partial [Bdellovibrio sp.]|nr:MFS transporter [Bdellovibrio sp.]
THYSLLTLFLVVFLDLVGFGIVIPILPYYAKHFGANAWQLGWLMTSYSLMQFLFAPVWGWISDQIGRKPILLVSILGSAFSFLILSMANSLEWLFIGRILAGICGANISTAYAYISDVTTEENRAKGMGLIGAGFGLGFIFGPAIGGLLSPYGYNVPMLFAMYLSVINFIFTALKLKEPTLTVEKRSFHRTKRFSLKLYKTVLDQPITRLAVLMFFIVTFAITQMEVCFALYLLAKFGFDAKKAGMLLALTGFIMVLIQGGLIGKLSKKWGEFNLLLFGTAICSLALFLFCSTLQISVLIISLVLLALGHGVLHPSLSSLASLGAVGAAKHLKGSTMGVFQSAGSLARILGPLVAGWFYDHLGLESPFITGAILLAISFFYLISTTTTNSTLEH